MPNSLTGTKEAIFDASIKLISTNGFENITMRKIANCVGIKAASIYYYYDSKEAILDSMYQYYLDNAFIPKKPLSYLKELLKTCTPRELVYAICYDYFSEDDKFYTRIILIVKIIYMRIFNDTKANDIYLNFLVKDGIEYTKEIIDYGIQIGRIEPIDSETFSFCLNGQINMMGINAFSKPNYYIGYLDEENRIKELFANMLKFKEI